jgi:hypothetical protein
MRLPAAATGMDFATAATCRLPISGLAVDIRQPTGREEMLLLEMPAGSAELALALAERLARAADGGSIAWRELPVADLDAFVLRMRQALLGDRIIADVRCREPDCGSRIDIAFSIAAYLDHHQPNRNWNRRRSWLLAPGNQGWSRLTPRYPSKEPSLEVQFRLPTVGDQLAAAGVSDGYRELVRRCMRPDDLPRRLRRVVETAMEAMAPNLSGDLEGVCPECGARVAVYFRARQFCLQELRNRAAFVYEDIDVLAQRYCWSERAILAIPNMRRANYAELARQSRNA